MRADRERWAPLTGIVFVVLVVAGAVTAANAPDTSADGAKVIDYYRQHQAMARISAVLLTLAFIALVFFAAAMRSFLRRREADGLAAVVLAGASILAAGQTLTEGFHWALATIRTDWFRRRRKRSTSLRTTSSWSARPDGSSSRSAHGWRSFAT